MTDLVRREAEFLLYQTEDGRTRVEVRFDGDTRGSRSGEWPSCFSAISRSFPGTLRTSSTRASWTGRQPWSGIDGGGACA